MNYYSKYMMYKNRYLDRLRGGSNPEPKRHTGAGVLLIERYHNKRTEKHGDVVILFSTFRNQCEELGGRIDKEDKDYAHILNVGDYLKVTAIREAVEESRDLIHLNPEHLDNHYMYDAGVYRCYIVRVADNMITRKDFYHNKEIITENKDNFGSGFHESVEMVRFYIDDIKKINLNTNEPIICNDTDGRIRTIAHRAYVVIRNMINNDLHLTAPERRFKIMRNANHRTINMVSI